MLFFFFSSRRRHTRFDCDWSSDVCSSDLHRIPSATVWERGRTSLRTRTRRVRERFSKAWCSLLNPVFTGPAAEARSEEHTSELQSQSNLVCRLLLDKKKILTTCLSFLCTV